MGPRQNVEADSGEKPYKPQALQKKGGNPIEKPSIGPHQVAPRRVGRPPKDKHLIHLRKQAQQLTKKALKVKKHLEISNSIARDLKIPQISSSKL